MIWVRFGLDRSPAYRDGVPGNAETDNRAFRVPITRLPINTNVIGFAERSTKGDFGSQAVQ